MGLVTPKMADYHFTHETGHWGFSHTTVGFKTKFWTYFDPPSSPHCGKTRLCHACGRPEGAQAP